MSAKPLPSACSFERWLMPYIDDELDAVHILDLEEHLQRCSDCSEQIAILRATRSSLRRVSQVEAPEGLRDRISQILVSAEHERSPATGVPVGVNAGGPRLIKLRYAMPLAAAAMFAIVLGAISFRQQPLATSSEHQASPTARAAAVQAATPFDKLLEDLVVQHAHPPPPEITDTENLGRFDPFVGVRVRRPELASAGVRYVGARMHRRTAMLQYLKGDRRRISVYVFHPKRVPVRSDRLRARHVGARNVYVGRVRGYSVAASEHRGVGYVLTSDLSDDENAQLVELAAR